MKILSDKLREERGDVYFEFLICLIIFVAFLSLSLQIFSAVKLKLWLDERTYAIMRNVQINGEITDNVDIMLEQTALRLGEPCVVEWTAEYFENTRKIQLGKTIRLKITGETLLFRLGKSAGVNVIISSEVVGTSEIYWKTP